MCVASTHVGLSASQAHSEPSPRIEDHPAGLALSFMNEEIGSQTAEATRRRSRVQRVSRPGLRPLCVDSLCSARSVLPRMLH